MLLREFVRIMVVDDMSVSRGLIAQALDGFGILNVTSAGNGKTALTMLESQPVHLVISDYHMPHMDGLQLLRNLRLMPNTADIGFVLITGSSQAHIIEEGKQLKMNNYITKPFKTRDLRTCLETVIGRF